jgi:hypothetical protein
MKYETDIITSITARPLSSRTRCDTGDNVFNVTMTDNFQYPGQSVDTKISLDVRDQRKNVQISLNSKYCTSSN